MAVAAAALSMYFGSGAVREEGVAGHTYADRSVQGLVSSSATSEAFVGDGETFRLEAFPVVKRVGQFDIRMYGYNGEIPGPLIRVGQGSSIKVNFTNMLGFDTTVHWHGLRLDNEFDGVPGVTQDPVKSGSSFVYELKFPDYGVYWYHPHVREDLQQELGLYGMIIVDPADGNVYSDVDSESTVFLDDIKVDGSDVDQFSGDYARFALMGRFGNMLFVNGDTFYERDAKAGDVVRFYFVNSANVRTFNISFDGAKMKIVGGDSGRYQSEFFSDSFVISPGERYIVDVLFEKSGNHRILHTTPYGTVDIGVVRVSGKSGVSPKSFSVGGSVDRDFPDSGEMSRYILKRPDAEIELSVDMGGMMQGGMGGMDHSMHGGAMMGSSVDDVEWEDDMGMMNSASTSDAVRWIIRDVATGRENEDLMMDAKVGDRMKLRISNPINSMHPMQHPIHLHGQRFLVLSENGRMNDNFVWKDVVLVKKGAVVDLMVDFTNPGDWMIHCHIPEHMESGMMAKFEVSR